MKDEKRQSWLHNTCLFGISRGTIQPQIAGKLENKTNWQETLRLTNNKNSILELFYTITIVLMISNLTV
jgi:hypothetical protein